MEIFRRPFKKTNTMFEIKFFIIIFILLGVPTSLIIKLNLPAILFLITLLLLIIHGWISQLFYIILTDDKLIIQNAVYLFWRKEAQYKDIMKIKMQRSLGAYPGVKVFMGKSSKILWRYTIDLVDDQNLIYLVEAIKAKGVVVEIKGF